MRLKTTSPFLLRWGTLQKGRAVFRREDRWVSSAVNFGARLSVELHFPDTVNLVPECRATLLSLRGWWRAVHCTASAAAGSALLDRVVGRHGE
jgi:hypothetical protein